MIKIATLIFSLVFLLAAAYFGKYYYGMKNVKAPNYTSIVKNKLIEIRLYQPMIIAEVTLTGNADKTINQGFKILAEYIFGNSLAMTDPVSQQVSTKIAMTAPVMHQNKSQDIWKVSFVMPEKHTIETLPKPNNKKISLKQIPEQKMVVIRFSGKRSEELNAKKMQKLQDYIKKNNLIITGDPIYAYYNPPWTLPRLRRNEIMYILAK